MDENKKKELIEEALRARKSAYAPYSHFCVGAALLTRDGKIYRGGNIENVSYGATNCAERTVFFKAVSEGCREFAAIAVAGGPEGREPENYAYPCGICRQVMGEFCSPEFKVFVVKSTSEYKEYALSEFMPYGFAMK